MSPQSMDRRQFLAGALATGAVTAVHGAIGPVARRTVQPRLSSEAATDNRILVLLTLYGGHDGLDTVVPYSDPAYYQQRAAIGVPASSALQLGQGFGFNPAFTGIKALWDAGQVAIIRGVGYPDPDYSHFESMDIWQSGDPSGETETGWIGRWLDKNPYDPLRSLWLGPNLPLAFVGKTQQASTIAASSSPNAQIPTGGAQLRSLYAELERVHRNDSVLQRSAIAEATNMLAVSQVVSQTLAQAPAVSQNFASTAAGLGTDLAVIAQLITAGMSTQVYGLSLGGFDSHAGEVASYATLLKELDSGVAGFFKAMQSSPQLANTVLVIYSEFGRRVAPNASGGTDHGSGSVAFAIGPSIKGGFYGDQPSLTQLDGNGSLIVTSDYRTIYATLLEQVLNFEPSDVLGGQFAPIPFM